MTIDTDPGIQCYVRHIRAAKICLGGAREWFAMRGWSYAEFLEQGRPSGDFLATGDPFAMRMLAAAMKESASG